MPLDSKCLTPYCNFPFMQCNSSTKQTVRIVRISDKANFNRQWAALVRGIESLPEGHSTDPVDQNPLVQYLYGHRQLDQYLAHLRNQASR